MSHRIFAGPFSGLENRWIDEIASARKDDPLAPTLVLIGSNILASYLKHRLAQTGHSVANLRFCTFVDLAGRLSRISPSEQKPRMPHLGASTLLRWVLSERLPSVFEPVAGFPGFRDALLDTFRDVRDAGIGPDEFDKDLRSWAGSVPDRKEHLEGLSDLYGRFRLQATLFQDADDLFRAAIRNTPSAPTVLGARTLLIYGLYDVTGQQSRLLSRLKDVLEMIYFIPFVDESVSGFAKPFLDFRAQELRVVVQKVTGPEGTNSLRRLENADFGLGDSRPSSLRDAKTRLQADGSFALVSAPGESRAAVEVIREILKAVHDGVVGGFHEIAVILRQPEGQVPILTEAFRLRRIPYFVHGGSSFAQRPLSKAVLAVCGLQTLSFSRGAILAAMELVAAALPPESALGWDVSDWRALTRDARFLAGIESWDAGTEALVREAYRELKLAEVRGETATDETKGQRALSPESARLRLEAARSLRAGWEALRQASSDWPGALPWRKWAELIEQRLDPLLGQAQDWDAFTEVVDELSGLDQLKLGAIAEEPVPRAELLAALAESLSGRSYPEGRFQRSGVNLISTSAARGLQFPCVIIPGLDEGHFPSRLRQDPLLLDSERVRFSTGNLPLKSHRIDEEKLLFDMAARSACKRLVLMTSRLDETSDRERIPSQFFLRAAAAARGGAVALRDLAEGVVPGFRSVSLERAVPRESEIAVDRGEIRMRVVDGEPTSRRNVLDALAALEPNLLSRPLAYDRARWNRRLTEYDGRIFDPGLVRWVADMAGPAAGQVSASRIEEYAKCPFYFYLRRVMKVAAWEEPEPADAMDPLLRGQVIHAVLENFLRDAGRLDSQAKTDLHERLKYEAAAALKTARPAGIPDLLWEIEQDYLLAMLENWLDHEIKRSGDGLCPAYLERTFGTFFSRQDYPAFRVQAGAYTFEFRGRIDRIDIADDRSRLRVIDYKTGRLPDSMENSQRVPLMSGERVQIAVYRGAISCQEDLEGIETVEGEYLHLQPRDGQIIASSLDPQDLQKGMEQLPAMLEIIGDGIVGGSFFARSRGRVRPGGHCDYCDYLPVCGKDRERREQWKSEDPAVLRFMQIRRIEGDQES